MLIFAGLGNPGARYAHNRHNIGFMALDTIARAHRASPWRAFWTVAIPLARPGFLAGAVLGFAHTVGEFGIVLMIGGNIPGKTKVLSVAIYDYVETSQWYEASILAAGMVIFAFSVILAMNLIEKRFARAGS